MTPSIFTKVDGAATAAALVVNSSQYNSNRIHDAAKKTTDAINSEKERLIEEVAQGILKRDEANQSIAKANLYNLTQTAVHEKRMKKLEKKIQQQKGEL